MNRKNERDVEEELKETIVQLKEIIDILQDSLSNRPSFNNLQRHKVTRVMILPAFLLFL